MSLNDDTIIKLTSDDDVVLDINVKAAKFSKLISEAFNLDEDDDDNDVNMVDDEKKNDETKILELKIERVNGDILKKIIEFTNYYSNKPFPLLPENENEIRIEESFEHVSLKKYYINQCIYMFIRYIN